MKYFAEIKNGIVVNLVQTEQDNLDGMPGVYIEYSQSGEFRKNPAEIGSSYDQDNDAFIPKKIHESWIWNNETFKWDPPVSKPDGPAAWDEENQVWNTPES